MQDRFWLYLALVSLRALVLDQFATGGEVLFFLLKKTFDLIEWLAFWR